MLSPPNEAYEIGWICALYEEFAAAQAMLDEEYGIIHQKDAQDVNTYAAGRIHNHNVVIACLPAGVHGTNAAATVAQNMLRTFPQLRVGLLVGIGGGIPHPEKGIDIRLGDVVVSQPDGQHGGVVQYDKGKIVTTDQTLARDFVQTGSLNKPPALLLNALSMLRAKHEMEDSRVSDYLQQMVERRPKMKRTGYAFPGTDKDHLFTLPLPGLGVSQTDQDVDAAVVVAKQQTEVVRRPRGTTDPEVHYGIIASGNSVVKHAATRDALRHQFGALCVEMEAAGLMDAFPCLVIRGICDYADSFKNDVWHRYAASTAAAYAKEFLLYISPQQTHESRPAREIVELLEYGGTILKQTLEHQQQAAKKSDTRYASEREQECHQAFKTSTYERYKDVNRSRVPGTCKWVLEHPQFQNWQQSSHNDLLWISADPGCGKSVLSKSLVDIEFQHARRTTLCYFFFKDNGLQDNLDTALCALLHQLFEQQPHLIVHALPSWVKSRNKLQSETHELWRIFLSATAGRTSGPVVCILDALDECGDDDRKLLIDWLCSFYQSSSTSSYTVKFLVTSRPYDSVQRWFEVTTSALPQIRLRGEDENDRIHDEINLVIDRQMDDLAAEFRLSKSYRDQLQERLRQMKHRTYLWLYLATEEIRNTFRDSPDPEEELVRSLPTSVENAYERILERITERQKPLARRILLIVLGARRPLTIDEVSLAFNTAIAYEAKQSFIRRPNVHHFKTQVREWCGLFVFFNHSRLYLIHQTAKEFLLTESTVVGPEPNIWKSSINAKDIDITMANICVTFLRLSHGKSQSEAESNLGEQQSIEERAQIGDRGLFRYCAEYWTTYVNDEAFAEDIDLLDGALFLYDANNGCLDSWFRLPWNTMLSDEPAPWVLSQHAAAINGHLLILYRISQLSELDLEARDSTDRTALHWAAELGRTTIVDWLIDAGAQLDSHGGDYGNALQAALAHGHEKIVENLLDAGADVHAQGDFENALYAAIAHGLETMVQMVLDAGIDSFTCEQYANAVFMASVRGNEKVVNILLEQGAGVHAARETLGNTILATTLEGHEKIAGMLIRQGTGLCARESGLRDTLHVASAKNYKEIVELLLDKGVDVNVPGGLYGTALQAALVKGHDAMVQMLRSRGAAEDISHIIPTPFLQHLDYLCSPPFAELEGHSGEVYCVAFSPDGKWLASGGEGGTCIIYDTVKYTVFDIVQNPGEPTCYVADISWSPDSSKVLITGFQMRAKVWDLVSRQSLMTLDHNHDVPPQQPGMTLDRSPYVVSPITSGAWQPDSQSLFECCNEDELPVRLCHLDKSEPISSGWHNSRVLAISPDGGRLLCASSNFRTLTVYNLESHVKEYEKTFMEKIMSITISQSNETALMNLEEGRIQLFNVRTGHVLRRFEHFMAKNITNICFGGAAENLVVSGSTAGYVVIWRRESSTIHQVLWAHEPGHKLQNCVSGVSWNPKKSWMYASAGDDGKVRIWTDRSNVDSKSSNGMETMTLASRSRPQTPQDANLDFERSSKTNVVTYEGGNHNVTQSGSIA